MLSKSVEARAFVWDKHLFEVYTITNIGTEATVIEEKVSIKRPSFCGTDIFWDRLNSDQAKVALADAINAGLIDEGATLK